MTNKRGPRGLKGVKGERGRRGPRVSKHDVLTAVALEFKNAHGEFSAMGAEVRTMTRALDTQLVRMGQIQRQLDQIHNLVKRILDGPPVDEAES